MIAIGGLDVRKENAALRNDLYLAYGVAYLALDMPGTGQSTQAIAAPSTTRVLGGPRLRGAPAGARCQARRCLRRLVGRTLGGAAPRYTERSRIRGAVVQAAPVHEYFQPESARKRWPRASTCSGCLRHGHAVYGVSDLGAFLAYGPKMSLVTSGMINQPSAPMLLINGLQDTQVPPEDLFLLMRSGSPKEVWFNPGGGHMGRTDNSRISASSRRSRCPRVVRVLRTD